MLLFKGNAVVLLERAYLPDEGSLERRRGGRASELGLLRALLWGAGWGF